MNREHRGHSTIERELEASVRGGNELTGWSLFSILWASRLQLLRCMYVAAVVSTVGVFLLSNRYQSTVRVVPQDSTQNMMMAAISSKIGGGLGSLLSGDMLGKNSGALFVGVLHSRSVQDRLVDRFDLRRVYWERYYAGARSELESRTQIEEDKKSGIITLTVTDKDPHRAAALANAYVAELNVAAAGLNTSSARKEREFLEGRLAGVSSDLDRAAKRFGEYSSKNATLDLRDQGKAMVDAAALLQGQIIAARSELEGLTQIYTAENVRVRAARARVAEMEAQMQKLSGPANQTITDVGSGSELYPSIRQLPILAVQWAQYYRDLKVQETVFELLTQQYELAKIQEAKETPSVRVLDTGDVPERKAFPPRGWFIFFSSLLGLALGAAWIGTDQMWNSIDDGDHRKQILRNFSSQVQRYFRPDFWFRRARSH